jgi:glycosyltransferase involved in cell wall biosynthesis
MKILQIIYESLGNPYGTGGAGIRAYEIYGRLKERHDITLLCMRYPGASGGDIGGLRHVFAGTESASLTKSVLAYTYHAAGFVRRYGGAYDVIVENFLPSTPIFSRLLTRTPVILQVQGVMQRHALKKFNPLHAVPMYLVEGIYPRFYRDFIFVSPVTRDRVLSRRRQEEGFCEVVPNGINRELLHAAAAEGDYVLFFSRIDIYTKGLDLLMEAFERVAAEFPGVRLILAGYEFDSAAKLREALPGHLRGRVEYAGFLTGSQKTELLAGAMVVVLPSRHESAPISIVEAAACARPVLVSDIPELRFVPEQGMGLAFRCGSADDLAGKMAQLLGDAGLRRHCGLSGREYARQFLWDNIALGFESALQSVCDAGEK